GGLSATSMSPTVPPGATPPSPHPHGAPHPAPRGFVGRPHVGDAIDAGTPPDSPRKPSAAVAGRPLRVSKGGGRSRRRRPGDMERKGLPATAGPLGPPRSRSSIP